MTLQDMNILITAEQTDAIDKVERIAISEQVETLEQRVAALENSPARDIEDRLAMVVFSGALDKAIAAFIIATGAAAMGLEVSMFFTFWGINIIKRERHFGTKGILEKGFSALMPGNSEGLPLSQMNYFGVGAKLIRKVMKDNNVTSLETLIAVAREFDVRLVSCDSLRSYWASAIVNCWRE